MSGFVVGDWVVWTHPTGIDDDTREQELVGCEGVIVYVDEDEDQQQQPYLVRFEVDDEVWWCAESAIQNVREDEL